MLVPPVGYAHCLEVDGGDVHEGDFLVLVDGVLGESSSLLCFGGFLRFGADGAATGGHHADDVHGHKYPISWQFDWVLPKKTASGSIQRRFP